MLQNHFRKISNDSEEINFDQFVLLLDAGTSGNPSRISSYISQNKSSIMLRKYNYFEKVGKDLPYFPFHAEEGGSPIAK